MMYLNMDDSRSLMRDVGRMSAPGSIGATAATLLEPPGSRNHPPGARTTRWEPSGG